MLEVVGCSIVFSTTAFGHDLSGFLQRVYCRSGMLSWADGAAKLLSHKSIEKDYRLIGSGISYASYSYLLSFSFFQLTLLSFPPKEPRLCKY